MARQWSAGQALQSVPLRNVYIVVRIFDVGGLLPKLWFITDPWASTKVEVVSNVQIQQVGSFKNHFFEIAEPNTHDDGVMAAKAIEKPAPTSFLDIVRVSTVPNSASSNTNIGHFTFEALLPPFQRGTTPTSVWTKFEPMILPSPPEMRVIKEEVYRSICTIKPFTGYSFEEIRLADQEAFSYEGQLARAGDGQSAIFSGYQHDHELSSRRRPRLKLVLGR